MEKLYAPSWNKTKTVTGNVSVIQNLAHQLNSLDQHMSEIAIVSKVTHILPPEFRHFISARDLVPAADKTLKTWPLACNWRKPN